MSEIPEVLRASDFLVLDQAFPNDIYGFLKDTFNTCEWKYHAETNYHALTKDATKEELLQDYGFTTMISDPDSIYNPAVHNAFENSVKEYFNLDKVLRIKAGLFVPSESEVVHYPHVDSSQPHWTALYYFSSEKDAGHTYIYNQKFDPFLYKDPFVQYDATKDKFDVLKKIEAKENRVVFFKGNVYHSSSRPRTVFKRIAVNVNFVGTPLAAT